MLRAITGAILGYIATAFLVMVGLTVLWWLVGAGIAFEAGTTRTTLAWSLPALALSAAAATLGGIAAARIGGSRATIGLVGLVIVLGALSIGLRLAADDPLPVIPEGRDIAELSSFEAAALARGPLWFDLVVPLVGAAGVALGGRLGGRG